MNSYQFKSLKLNSYLLLLLSSFLLTSCGGGGGEFGNVAKFEKLVPYQTSKYSSHLKKCVSVTKSKDSCLLSKLPLIGQLTDAPTDKEILDRLVVSHTWMGDNFKEALKLMPNDIRLMFRSVTAIVIDEGIRPSHYTPVTGAIYLDPANVWLTNTQKNDIKKDEDYRSNYGNKLSFKEFNVLTKNGRLAFNTRGNIKNSIERTMTDVVGPLTVLLFHELAHANDFFLPSEFSKISSTETISEAIERNFNNKNTASHHLYNNLRLQSSPLFSLAKVRFRGATPTTLEKYMSASTVGHYFEAEGAIMHYAYNTQYEDMATLLAAGMMKKHFNIDGEQFFVDYSSFTTYNSACDYTVATGSRNRIANPEVTSRMLSVMDDIFPNGNHRSTLNSWLGSQTLKTAGNSVCSGIYAYQKKSIKTKTANIEKKDIVDISTTIMTGSPHSSSSR